MKDERAKMKVAIKTRAERGRWNNSKFIIVLRTASPFNSNFVFCFTPLRQPYHGRQVFGNRATRRRRVKKRITFHIVKARRRPFYRRQALHPKTCLRAVFALLFGGKKWQKRLKMKDERAKRNRGQF